MPRCTRPARSSSRPSCTTAGATTGVRARRGEIVPPRPGAARGALGAECHAFLVVGYTPKGFLVLNSWGRDWGGWRAGARRHAGRAGPGRRALALRRLGRHRSWTAGCSASASARPRPSSTRSATRASASAPRRRCARRRCTPSSATSSTSTTASSCASGAYVSTHRTLEETRAPARREDASSAKPYQGVLLTFAGGLHRACATRPSTSPAGSGRCATRAGTPSPSSGASTTSSRRARVLDGVFARRRARRRPGRALRPRWSRSWPTASAARSGATSACAAERAARPNGPLHDLARAGAGARRRARRASASASSPSPRAPSRSQPSCARCGPRPSPPRPSRSSRCSQSVDLVAPPLTRAEYAALARLPQRRLGRRAARPADPAAPADRPRREAPRRAALRPLLLRAGAPRLPAPRRGYRAAAPPPTARHLPLARRRPAFAAKWDALARARRAPSSCRSAGRERRAAGGAGADHPDRPRLPLRRGRPPARRSCAARHAGRARAPRRSA